MVTLGLLYTCAYILLISHCPHHVHQRKLSMSEGWIHCLHISHVYIDQHDSDHFDVAKIKNNPSGNSLIIMVVYSSACIILNLKGVVSSN